MLDILKHYQYLHAHPEISKHEVQTTHYILSILKQYDLDLFPLEHTGVIARTKTHFEEDLVFRADIDALPITEKTESSYQSTHQGVMHACGHDLHTAALLQFIDQILNQPESIPYNLTFVFQPSEEVDGGAQSVLASEIMQNIKIKAIHGVHVWPALKKGTIATKAGVLFGTNLVFNVTLQGKSSHAATPHLAKEVLTPMMRFIDYTRELIAIYNDPFEPLVINVGKINGGDACNIVMKHIQIDVTARCLNDHILQQVEQKLKAYLAHLEAMYSIEAIWTQTEGICATVVNDPQLVDLLADESIVMVDRPTLAVEDFGHYKSIAPAIMFWVGTDEGEKESLHSATFLPSPDVIFIIADLYERIVFKHIAENR